MVSKNESKFDTIDLSFRQMNAQDLILSIETEAAKWHIEPSKAAAGQTHVYVLFNDGEIVFTKCGEKGYMFGDRNFHLWNTAITRGSLPIHFPMPWRGMYTCVVLNDEAKANELRDKMRLLLLPTCE